MEPEINHSIDNPRSNYIQRVEPNLTEESRFPIL